MPTRFVRVSFAFTVLAAVTCASPGPAAHAPKVLILYDGSVPDARAIVDPAVLGADLGLRRSGLEPWLVDTGGDRLAASAAAAALDDHPVVGAIIAPFADPGSEALARLEEEGIATISLSHAPMTPSARFRRMVPELETTSELVAIAGAGACVIAGDDPWGRAVADRLARSATTWRPVSSSAGCDTIVWSGPADGAEELRRGFDGLLVVTDQARTPGLARAIGPLQRRTIGVCGCVDPASMTDPPLQEFVHAYQEETGLDPGPYAAEAFDAATLLASVASGQTGLHDVVVYEGTAGRYVWDRRGVLATPLQRRYEATGVRWLPS